MNQGQDIQIFDPHRWLIGQAPTSFLWEVLARAVLVYLLLWICMRLMGKRLAGQMSGMELTIVVTLGAAIGVPLQAPDRGMLPALLILGVAVLYQRGLNLWAFKSRKGEVILQGDVSTMAKDGCLDLHNMRRAVLSQERLFATLRQERIIHLGEVKRLYLEADGHFSIYKQDDPPPGLCLLPAHDTSSYEKEFGVPGVWACGNCGNLVHQDRKPDRDCPRCEKRTFSPAVQATQIRDLKTESDSSAA